MLVYVSVIDVVNCNYECHHDTVMCFCFMSCLSSD